MAQIPASLKNFVAIECPRAAGRQVYHADAAAFALRFPQGRTSVIFTGSLTFTAEPARVWETLLDVDQIAGCIPGLQSVSQLDDRTFDGIVEAGVGPVSGRFSFRSHIVESEPPRELLARLDGTDSVTKSTVTGETAVTLASLGDGRTLLTYRSTMDVKGRLAILGEMVLRATGDMMLRETAERLRQQVEASRPPH